MRQYVTGFIDNNLPFRRTFFTSVTPNIVAGHDQTSVLIFRILILDDSKTALCIFKWKTVSVFCQFFAKKSVSAYQK